MENEEKWFLPNEETRGFQYKRKKTILADGV